MPRRCRSVRVVPARLLYDANMSSGAFVTIADVSPEDMFASYKSALIGQVCQVKKEDLESSGEGWFSGTVKCGSEKLYFYQLGVYY